MIFSLPHALRWLLHDFAIAAKAGKLNDTLPYTEIFPCERLFSCDKINI